MSSKIINPKNVPMENVSNRSEITITADKTIKKTYITETIVFVFLSLFLISTFMFFTGGSTVFVALSIIGSIAFSSLTSYLINKCKSHNRAKGNT